MNFELVAMREAVTAWRDRAIVEIAGLLDEASKESFSAYESGLYSAGAMDMVWAPARHASAAIDREMGNRCVEALKSAIERSAQELGEISPRLQALSEALAASAQEISVPDAMVEAENTDVEPVRELTVIRSGWRSRFNLRARRAKWKTSGAISDVAESAAKMLRDHTFLHNRLRSAAEDHLRSHWLAWKGEPRSVLSQAAMMIDETAFQARMAA